MNGPSVFFAGATGFVNAGTGPVTVNTYDPQASSDPTEMTARAVAADQMSRQYRSFVSPPGLGRARVTLARWQTLLLDAEHGTGRTAAALVLLHELRSDRGMLHELAMDEQETRLDTRLIGDGDRIVLDLSSESDDAWAACERNLASFRSGIVDRGAHLVVVLPRRRAARMSSDYVPFLVELGRADELRVLRRHLRVHGLAGHEICQDVPKLTKHLARQPPMREIAELADLIRRAREEGPQGAGLAHWCDRALNAVGDRRGEVENQMTNLRAGPQRALLLTTAMLHGAHVHLVDHAATKLLRATGQPAEAVPKLEHRDLAERLDEIDAVSDTDCRVRFRALDYDTAVRRHFWTLLPGARPALNRWVGELALSHDLEARDRRALVEHFVTECLRTGHPEDVLGEIRRWLGVFSPTRHQVAAHALELGLQSVRHPRPFRRQLLDWAKDDALPAALSRLTTEVSAGILAFRNPDLALVRLHHLARRQRDSRQAVDALVGLILRGDAQTLRNDALYRRLMSRLAHPDRDSVRYAEVDQELFLTLAVPGLLINPAGRRRPLLDESALREDLTTVWRGVMAQRQPDFWQARTAEWLTTASFADRVGDYLLDVLIAGTSGEPALMGRLYTVARRVPDNPGLAPRLLRKITVAQQERAPRPATEASPLPEAEEKIP